MHDMKYIYGNPAAKNADETREVKVKLPVGILIQLHGVKIVKGHNVSDTVTRALERYFAKGQKPPQ